MANTFRARLRLLRDMRRLTQREVAEQLGIAPSTLGMYEAGKREPDNDLLVAIAAIYETSTDYLLGLTDNPAPASTSARTAAPTSARSTSITAAYCCVAGRVSSSGSACSSSHSSIHSCGIIHWPSSPRRAMVCSGPPLPHHRRIVRSSRGICSAASLIVRHIVSIPPYYGLSTPPPPSPP